jgi:hypothetical protein
LLTSFEEIGFIDPFDKNGRKKTEKIINAMSLKNDVYPDKVMAES